MAFSWSHTTDGNGLRITDFANSMVSSGFSLVAARLGSVVTMDSTSRVETEESSADMTVGASSLGDLTDWSVRLDSGVDVGGSPRFQWTTYGTVDNSAGVESMKLRPKLVMGAGAKASTIMRCCSYEFTIAPIGGDASTCKIVVPGTESEIRPWNWADIADPGEFWSYPGTSWSGGENIGDDLGDTSHLPYDEPKGSLLPDAPSFAQDLYIWNDGPSSVASKTGLMFRFDDPNGVYKLIGLSRDGSGNLKIALRFCCQDNSTGINGDSDTDFAFGVEIRPMVGEAYDFHRYCQAREQAENHPQWTETLTLADWVKDLVFTSYLSGGDYLATFEPYHVVTSRVASHYGLSPWEMAAQIYDHQKGPLGLNSPVQAPFKATAATWIQAMYDDGIAPIMYSVDEEPQQEGVDGGLPASFNINDSLVRTRVGYTIPGYGDLGDLPISGENPTPGYGSDEGNIIFRFNYLDASANQQLLDFSIAENDELSGKMRGRYADATSWAAAGNDDFRLDPDERSCGSTAHIPAVRAFLRMHRARLAAYGLSDPALFVEFPNPATVIGIADLCHLNPINPPAYSESNPGALYPRTSLGSQIRYGSLIAFSSYLGFGSGPTPKFDAFVSAGWASKAEIFAYVYALWFHGQIIPPIQAIWNSASDDIGWIFESGDGNYADFLAQAGFFSLLGTMSTAEKGLNRACRFGQRLRELPSSSFRRGEAFVNDGVDPIAPAAKVISSIYRLTDGSTVCARFTNWSLSGHHPVTVDLDDVLTVADWPELGSSNRDVYFANLRTGETRKVDGWDGASFSFSGFSVGPADDLAFLFVTEGSEPPHIEHSPTSTLSMTGAMTSNPTSSSLTMHQGTNQRIRLTLAKGSTGLIPSHVVGATFKLSKTDDSSTVRLSLGRHLIAVSDDSENLYLDVDLVPSDTEDLVGDYRIEWTGTLGEAVSLIGLGTLTILESEVT